MKLCLSVLIDPYTILPPLDQTVVQGGTVSFSIIAGGNLPMSFRWRRGGTTLTNLTLNSGTSFYTINNAQPTDQGTYTVILTNAAFYAPGVLSPRATLTVLADGDGDGVPDEWETQNGFDLADATDATQDIDGDGMTTHDEYVAGTDPRDENSYLRVEGIEQTDVIAVSFIALSNHTYTVEFSDLVEPGGWMRLEDVTAHTTNRTAVVLDPAHADSRIYRLVTPRQP